jgi:hypothetical protein
MILIEGVLTLRWVILGPARFLYTDNRQIVWNVP